jgi:hypothetical protein
MGKDYPVTDTFLAVNGGNQRWGLGLPSYPSPLERDGATRHIQAFVLPLQLSNNANLLRET